MNDLAYQPRSSIDLAGVKPFSLGPVEVRPGTRQLVEGGRARTLEPRVMQVLVALWEARGEVVSRDELVRRCWSGRIVGDNAIHRAISRLREVGSETNAFEIETISKVGYRLTATDAREPAAETGDRARQGHDRRYLVALAVCAGLGLAGASVGMWASASPAIDELIVTPAASELAPGLAEDLSRGMSVQNLPIGVRSEETTSAPLLLDARQTNSPGGLATYLTLRTGKGEQLWSSRIDGLPANFRDIAVANSGHVLSCAKRLADRLNPLAPSTLRLIFSACDQLPGEPTETLAQTLRSVAERTPGSAAAWAQLASVEAFLGTPELGDPQTPAGSAYLDAARQHLKRASKIDPDHPDVLAVQSRLLNGADWRRKLALEERGMARTPSTAAIHILNSRTSFSLGLLSDSVRSARQAAALEPYNPGARANLILVLAHAGFVEEAAQELKTAKRTWPTTPVIADADRRFAFRYGEARDLLSDQAAMSTVSAGSPALRYGSIGAFLEARAESSPASVQRAVDEAARLWRRFGGAPILYLQTLAQFGRVDEAYDVLNDPGALAYLRQSPDILFRSGMRPVRNDARFVAVADRIGLVALWSGIDRWPDFCGDPGLPYDCMDEVRKLRRTPS